MGLRWGLMLLLMVALHGHAEALRVGFGTHKPPYVFEGEPRGLEYELIEAVLRRSGFELNPYYGPIERMHMLLQRGDLDAIATTNPYDGSAPYYSAPYIEYHNVVVALAARHYRIERIADLGAYSISTFQRARFLLGPEFSAMAEHNPQYREEAQQITRNRLLYSGRVDLLVIDPKILGYFNREVAEQVDIQQPLTWYRFLPPTPYRVGFRDDGLRARFDKGLEAIRGSGEYRRIEQRYQDN